ncbi:MAG: ribosome maturation factor RimM [Anaerolineales bacterium]
MDSDHPSTNKSARQPPEYLAVGRVVRPHGVRGGLKVSSNSELIYKLEPSVNIYLGAKKDPLAPLPEGEFFHWQIVGLHVITTAGEELGTIEEIMETGANDVYLVRDSTGKEILLPAIESVIQDVDLENERIVVRLIPGLIE